MENYCRFFPASYVRPGLWFTRVVVVLLFLLATHFFLRNYLADFAHFWWVFDIEKTIGDVCFALAALLHVYSNFAILVLFHTFV
jgi:hypothetical protein